MSGWGGRLVGRGLVLSLVGRDWSVPGWVGSLSLVGRGLAPCLFGRGLVLSLLGRGGGSGPPALRPSGGSLFGILLSSLLPLFPLLSAVTPQQCSAGLPAHSGSAEADQGFNDGAGVEAGTPALARPVPQKAYCSRATAVGGVAVRGVVAFSNSHPDNGTLESLTFPEHPRFQPSAATSGHLSAPGSPRHLGCPEIHLSLGFPRPTYPEPQEAGSDFKSTWLGLQ